jgi:hypothetical protein
LMFAGYSNGDCYVWDTLVAEVCHDFLLNFAVERMVHFFQTKKVMHQIY